MDINLIDTYFPTLEEITQDKLDTSREKVAAYFQSVDPTIDTAPNTPFGDIVVNKAAAWNAAMEIAMERFCSDLDPEQVASGVIYNCDFVKQYLKMFGTAQDEKTQAFGIIRFVFSKPDELTIDRRTKISFGGDSLFYFLIPVPGNLHILPPGASSPEPSTDPLFQVGMSYNLSENGDNSYVVDLPVIGYMNPEEPVEEDDNASSDTAFPNISVAYALNDFTLGVTTQSLPELAKRTRELVYSVTPNTRGGARRFVKQFFPTIPYVSPVVPGDIEMQRDTPGDIFGVDAGKMDIFMKSNVWKFLQSHTIRLKYSSETDSFFGEIPPSFAFGDEPNAWKYMESPMVPYYVKNIEWQENPQISFNVQDGDHSERPVKLIIDSADSDKVLPIQSAYSRLQRLYIDIPMPRDTDGNARIRMDVDDNQNHYAIFTVYYYSDPMLKIVSETITHPNYAPIGIDILVRNFMVAHFKSFTVKYRKRTGVTTQVAQAVDDIYNYLMGCSYPNLYSEGRIAEIMSNAGAEDIVEVTCDADLFYAPATHRFQNYNHPRTSSSPVVAIGNIIGATNPRQLLLSSATTGFEQHTAHGPKNITPLLDKENIILKEIIY